ncbi:MAG: efflux RND transporter permease subunit [Alphaproteobacteria bacterium]|nr:efflux RND transporter permease subunit [Alphaproteobacteria bacterium]
MTDNGPTPAPAPPPEGGLFELVVSRPIAVLMIFIAAAVFGFVSYNQLPLNLMPDLSYPTLTVRTEYAGAAPQEVESQVSRPVEEALSTVDGLVSIESRSRAESSDVVLEFNWGTDMSSAAQSVRERLQTTWLSEGVGRPLILSYDPSLDPILRIALSIDPSAEDAPEGAAALFLLRELAEEEIKRDLEGLDGVAAVRVRGGLERQVLVEVREDWLAARGVTLDQVRSTLVNENVNLAGGSIREGDTEYLLRTLNELTTVEEIAGLEVVRSDGVTIPIGELADVRETFKDREVVSHLDGREAVEMEVFKEADANIVTVAARVKAWLGDPASARGPPEPAAEGMPEWMKGPPTLAERLPDAVTFAVLDDQAQFIEEAVANLRSTAVLGGWLAVIILFLFLRDLRATSIIATAIPISVICAFAPMYLGGVSLNLMSLGGLALGVGMLVDNAVVVLEAIQVYREQGASRKDAAVAGVREVAAAVTASTLTTVAVFLPIVFVEGVAGQVFGDLALAVVVSLLASLLVALFFVPMLAARELRLSRDAVGLRDLSRGQRFPAWAELKDSVAQARARGGLRWLVLPYALLRFALRLPMEAFGNLLLLGAALGGRLVVWAGRPVAFGAHRVALGLAEGFGRAYDRLAARYPELLSGAMARPGGVLVGASVALVLALMGMGLTGRVLIPEVHQGRFTVELALPVGTPLDRTVAVMSRLEAEVGAVDGVARVYSAIGSEGRADARPDEGEHSARMLVQLSPSADPETLERAVIHDVRALLAADPDVEVNVVPPALFTFRTPVEVVLTGTELDTLRRLSDAAVARLTDAPGLRDVKSSLVPGYPEVRIRYDRRQIERFGLTTASVAQALRDKIQGAEASRLSRGERKVDLVVRLIERDRESVEDLARINVNPRLDPPIPLTAVARLESAEGPSEIRRIDQQRGAVITANLDGLDLASTDAVVTRALSGLEFPEGYDFRVAGQTLEMQRSLRSLSFALLLAVFLVYVIMASTFESLVHPFVILFAVPLAAVGVVPALLLTGTSLSVVVFIGFIVLAGMVVNNAIVLVDRINRSRAEGADLDEALLSAGRARLRPILITTATTVLGLLPLSLGFGAGAEIQQPLALTVIAGLLSSTLLTLLVVPVLYRIVAARVAALVEAP